VDETLEYVTSAKAIPTRTKKARGAASGQNAAVCLHRVLRVFQLGEQRVRVRIPDAGHNDLMIVGLWRYLGAIREFPR
jgi:hypothetical protein